MKALDPSGSMSLDKVFFTAEELVAKFAERGGTDIDSVITELSLGNTGADTVVFITDGNYPKGNNPLVEIYNLP